GGLFSAHTLPNGPIRVIAIFHTKPGSAFFLGTFVWYDPRVRSYPGSRSRGGSLMIKRSLPILCLGLLTASLWAQPSLKVNEVSTGNPSWIEIANLGSSVNVGGYIIRFGGNSGITFLQGSYVLPSMTLGTNQVLVITEDVSAVLPAVPAGVFKAYCGSSI